MRIYFYEWNKTKSNARALNFGASNAWGPRGRVHWTSIKFRQVHWICLILLEKVNANLLT